MAKKKLVIKKVNDFVLSILMLIVGLYVVFGPKTVSHIAQNGLGGFFARPDVYMKALAVALIVLSIILIIKSIGFVEFGEKIEGFKFYVNREIIFTTILLIVYTIVLPKIGFFISTFLMVVSLVLIFSYRKIAHDKDKNKKLKRLMSQFQNRFLYLKSE